MDEVDLDLSQESQEESAADPIIKSWHPEKEKMRLAYWVLGSVLLIFIIAIASNYFSKLGFVDEAFTAQLFDLCKTGLLPIVTFILGYYFSSVD